MHYVEEEIQRKNDTGGDFAAASDILRWLGPSIKKVFMQILILK